MTDDLFGEDKRSRKGGGKVPSSPPLGRKGKGKGPEPSQGSGKVPGPSKNLYPDALKPEGLKRRNPEKETGLRQRLAKIYEQLEEAHSEVERHKPISDHLGQIFREADTALRAAHASRLLKGEPMNLFPFYDARVAAGFAWNPHRTALNTALSWRKSIMDEAKMLNKELGT